MNVAHDRTDAAHASGGDGFGARSTIATHGATVTIGLTTPLTIRTGSERLTYHSQLRGQFPAGAIVGIPSASASDGDLPSSAETPRRASKPTYHAQLRGGAGGRSEPVACRRTFRFTGDRRDPSNWPGSPDWVPSRLVLDRARRHRCFPSSRRRPRPHTRSHGMAARARRVGLVLRERAQPRVDRAPRTVRLRRGHAAVLIPRRELLRRRGRAVPGAMG